MNLLFEDELPKSYPFPLNKADALPGYLELTLGAKVTLKKTNTEYEVMALCIERSGEKANLNLHRKGNPEVWGTLTPQHSGTELFLDLHKAIQAIHPDIR